MAFASNALAGHAQASTTKSKIQVKSVLIIFKQALMAGKELIADISTPAF